MEETEAEDSSEELKQTESEIEKLNRTVPSKLDECSEFKDEVEKALEDSSDRDELETKEDKLSDKLSRKEEKIKSEFSELLEKDEELLSNLGRYYTGGLTFLGFLIDPFSKGAIFK